VRLLAAIREAFDSKRVDRFSSKDLVEALRATKQDVLTFETGLPRMLKPFGIRPHVIRIGSATPRGYLRTDFEDAWARYLPPPDKGPAPPSLTATSATMLGNQ
jgi:hypothetical protein